MRSEDGVPGPAPLHSQVVAYAVSFDIEPNKFYADMHVGIVYHCGVISCHICTYYISQNVESIVEKLEAAKKK